MSRIRSGSSAVAVTEATERAPVAGTTGHRQPPAPGIRRAELVGHLERQRARPRRTSAPRAPRAGRAAAATCPRGRSARAGEARPAGAAADAARASRQPLMWPTRSIPASHSQMARSAAASSPMTSIDVSVLFGPTLVPVALDPVDGVAAGLAVDLQHRDELEPVAAARPFGVVEQLEPPLAVAPADRRPGCRTRTAS